MDSRVLWNLERQRLIVDGPPVMRGTRMVVVQVLTERGRAQLTDTKTG